MNNKTDSSDKKSLIGEIAYNIGYAIGITITTVVTNAIIGAINDKFNVHIKPSTSKKLIKETPKMIKYKIVWDNGEEEDELYDDKDFAIEQAEYLQGCFSTGAEILHMSNPGDYDEDDETPDYEIVEVEV